MPKYEILRYIVPAKDLQTLPVKLIEEILSYLPVSSIAALCQVYPAVMRIVCEHNRTRYFGYRKHLAETFMPAILFGAYKRVEGEEMTDHSKGAKELAVVICTELGKNR
ncbi:hypothetical protein TWF281_005341 [Arthrobotrys megalospora]